MTSSKLGRNPRSLSRNPDVEASLQAERLTFVWKERDALDVTDARPGRNSLSIRVVNTWVNRLIGDAAMPKDQRIIWTTLSPCRAGDLGCPRDCPAPQYQDPMNDLRWPSHP